MKQVLFAPSLYDLNKNKPARARAMPKSRAIDAGSLKNKIPAIAITAAPPAKIIARPKAPTLLEK